MKLIIDIDENIFTRLFDNGTEGMNVEDMTEVGKVIRNGIPLDKLRAEVEQITDTMGVSYNQYVSKIDVLQIIDRYIGG